MNLSNDEPKTTEDFIKKQIKEEGLKDLDNLEPIDHGTLAKPHTPVYKMHRYFARRPYSVFNELIKHYSNPGSIILDPFCGGGVTIVEALRLRRKVIGVDLNPMATFITRMEVVDVDLNELEKAFKEIEKNVKNEILDLYKTKCPKCKKETPAEWFEWSYIYKCSNCNKDVQISETQKITKGKYKCYNCNCILTLNKIKKVGEKIIRIKVSCSYCKAKFEKKEKDIDKQEYDKIIEIEKLFKKSKYFYPKDKILKGQETQRLLNAGYTYFYELFTTRNLYASCLLLDRITKIKEEKVRKLIKLAFTSRLYESSRLAHIKKGTIVKPGHHYWLADVPAEANIWMQFNNARSVLLSGREYSLKEINDYFKKANSFKELLGSKTCIILTRSSTSLPIPDKQIDIIITDPPYGGNVNYSEMCDFWAIWIKDEIGMKKDELIDDKEEAIKNKYQEKGDREYRDLMFKIFKECYRVLKPGRWMVMTFHNRDFAVWNDLHLAAHDAGFILSEDDGMIYQPPIQAYTTTLHQKESGSMLGDFILSFQKAEKKPKIKMIEEVEIGNKVRKVAEETIEYHGGAKLSTIYMRLVPFLLNNGILHRFGEKDITPFLKKDFVERNGKWYFKENIDEKGDVKPIEYVPVEARIEYLIRSLLYERKQATTDEVLEAVFTNLINGNAAEYEEISKVLSRIAEKKDERNWQLKELGSEAQRQILQFIEKREKPKVAQQTLTGEELTTEESIHDLMIKQLAALGEDEGYSSHIGQTEQRKYVEFRKMSIPMGNNVQYGLNRQAFDIIREIDLLWLKGDTIVAAFEIEKSTTIDSGINRFRNLFAATPNQNIPAYIVIPDNREKEAVNKIGSLANRKDKLYKKIKYLLFSDIKNKKGINIEDKAREVV